MRPVDWCSGKNIAIGAGGRGSIPGLVELDTVSATVAAFLRSCVAQALSHQNGFATCHMLWCNTASIMKI